MNNIDKKMYANWLLKILYSELNLEVEETKLYKLLGKQLGKQSSNIIYLAWIKEENIFWNNF